ncbi:DUF1553 domain-containing protein [Compostibacter hankyongensis]
MRHKRKLIITAAAVLCTVIVIGVTHKSEKVDFSTEVKPILNQRCIICHGGVKQSGGFSVLFREEALGKTKSGKPAIIPGDPEHSEFMRRLTTHNVKERMPYKNPPLSKKEISILRRWIKQGAKWGKHWAYELPETVAVPGSQGKQAGFGGSGSSDWGENEIDAFVLNKLKTEDMKPSPEADKYTLLRRVSLDITGVLPDQATINRYLNDKSDKAYERLVDTLLASPQYGERWAALWLDLARYSDTKGYEKDLGRNVWRYRDWVIRAFNADMPFDQFTIKQLAGDLLPNATDDDMIATAFHRNTMNNDEGGTDDEEFRTAAVIDRVNTTWEVWQGTTFACVQCHSHPYDPFKHEDFYKFMAFFNNTRDEDTPADYPNLRLYDSLDREKVRDIVSWVKQYGEKEEDKKMHLFLKTVEPKINAHVCDDYINGALVDTKYLGIRSDGSCRMKQVQLDGKTHLLMRYWTGRSGGSMEIHADSLSGPLILRTSLQPTNGAQITSIPLTPVSGTHDIYFRFKNAGINPEESVCSVEWFAFRKDLPGKGQPGYAEKEQEVLDLLNSSPDRIPVMVDNPADQTRPTYVFERGNWMVHGARVSPDVPKSLNPFPAGAPRNRLGLARWLTDQKNPLTARVTVNRYWEQLFGNGIVETVEDFGSQGFAPTHPQLLDWLALKFMKDYKWSMKKLLKEMVMSATYRQDSKVTPEMLEKDPANHFFARGPRFRLTAEEIRDESLRAAGLLSHKMYGPSVMPYQPEGIWQSVYSGARWIKSKGEDQYRRGVYTYMKRTSPYPSMITLDASSREVCLARRIRTNTPLQALTTLNDPVFMEAAGHLAQWMEKQGRKDAAACIREGYKRVMVKDISSGKLAVLQDLYRQTLKEYRQKPAEAAKLTGESGEDAPHRAALTVVANALLNLDEFMTKS